MGAGRAESRDPDLRTASRTRAWHDDAHSMAGPSLHPARPNTPANCGVRGRPQSKHSGQCYAARPPGPRVRPQHVIRGWIVDSYCYAARLVIEVDGDIHDLQRAEDERRTRALHLEGLEVLRVRNEEVLSEIADFVARIVEAIHPPTVGPDHSALPTLPPLVGAGPGVGARRAFVLRLRRTWRLRGGRAGGGGST